ncbi:MAG TPA: J domain-containing protein [Noviherbaspirillum sp.]|nr:J domain-containing protein [Noviherbaspirillum sp.]
MARVHTHYDNLKVARNAPPEVIRAAYKTLSQKHHPDRNGNSENAIRIIQIINSAYDVLSDPGKRREHDEWIARAEAETIRVTEKKNVNPSRPTSPRQSSKTTRRRSSFHIYPARHRELSSLWPLSGTIHKMRMMFDHFSRKLFRKI